MMHILPRPSLNILKVSDSRIVIAVDSSHSDHSDFNLPERCRLLKLANSVTYDREVFVSFTPYLNETCIAGWKAR
jgi:DNA polymerase alpha-associated DNA helicase A